MGIHERFGDMPEIDLGEPLQTRAQQKATLRRLQARVRRREQALLTPPPTRDWAGAGVVLLAVFVLIIFTLAAADGQLITAGW